MVWKKGERGAESAPHGARFALLPAGALLALFINIRDLNGIRVTMRLVRYLLYLVATGNDSRINHKEAAK
jgi:hypothetical protein